jgi:hypothetical protein
MRGLAALHRIIIGDERSAHAAPDTGIVATTALLLVSIRTTALRPGTPTHTDPALAAIHWSPNIVPLPTGMRGTTSIFSRRCAWVNP